MTLSIISSDWRFKERFKQHFSPACLRSYSAAERALADIEAQTPDVLVIDTRLKEGAHTLLLQQLQRMGTCSTILYCIEEEGDRSFVPKTSLCLFTVLRCQMYASKIFEFLDPSVAENSAYETCGLIGESEAMVEVRRQLSSWGRHECPIHLYGETGTGKELAAQFLHRLKAPYRNIVSVNCSLLSDALGKSMFFGHTKGAFTDGTIELNGLIREADGSTLFLDEVENLSLHFQAHLLRLLESGQYRRFGDTKLYTSNFRLITASNERLDQLVESSAIRKDFLYRICDVVITLPPLRDHTEDIPSLVEAHLASLGVHKSLDARSLALLTEYEWPGNVRELFSVIRRAVITGSEGNYIKVTEDDIIGPLKYSYSS